MKQRVPFFSIISLLEFQKRKLKYFENGLVKSHENFAKAVTCHYILLIVLTKFLVTLSTWWRGSAWYFLKFGHYKSMAISADKFKVHCSRNGRFKFYITFGFHAYISPLGSGGVAKRWKMLSTRGGAPCTHSHHYNSMALLARTVNAVNAKTYERNFKKFQDSRFDDSDVARVRKQRWCP